MTTNNGWPGKPGVPINPEQDGWHWLQDSEGNKECASWRERKFLGDGRGLLLFVGYEDDFQPHEIRDWTYLGPVLMPDEAAALQQRVAELEALTRAKVTEIERAYSHEGHCIECHGVVRAWGDAEHRDDCWYVKARVVLERKE